MEGTGEGWFGRCTSRCDGLFGGRTGSLWGLTRRIILGIGFGGRTGSLWGLTRRITGEVDFGGRTGSWWGLRRRISVEVGEIL